MLRTILVALSLTLSAPAVADPWINDRNPQDRAWGEIDFNSIETFKADGHVFVVALTRFCMKDRNPNCYAPDGADYMVFIVPAAHCGEGKGRVKMMLYREGKKPELMSDTHKTWSKDVPTVGSQATWLLCKLAFQKAKGAKGI